MLQEGETSAGSVNKVRRIGNTIHRPSYPWTETVNDFLMHLHRKGLPEIGVPLGVHTNGKSVYTYLPGKAALRPWSAILKRAKGLELLSDFLLRYQEAQRDYKLPQNITWYVPEDCLQSGSIIRHGDFGPWNTLWQDQKLSGVIDWDFAEPGTALQDFAQLAWYTIPLRGESGWKEAGFENRPDFKARLQTICKVGNFHLKDLLEAVIDLQNLEMDRLMTLGAEGVFPWSIFYKRGDLLETRQEQAWLKQQILIWL